MTPNLGVGRILTTDEALAYYEAVGAAEQVMGSLTREEKMVILTRFGAEVTNDDLITALQQKRVLVIKGKEAL